MSIDKLSYLNNAHPEVLDEMYAQYLQNPESLEIGWRKFFEGFEFARTNPALLPSDDLKKTDKTEQQVISNSLQVPEKIRKEFSVINLINLYRSRGHLFTKTNPVRVRRNYKPNLDEIELIGLSQDDMDTVFQAGNEIGIGAATLRNIIAFLKQTYCQSIGVEYMHIRHPKITEWLQTKIESCRNTPNFTLKEKRNIFYMLNKAVAFENFLHTRFVGDKRFSLEGCETLIPALDAIIERGAESGIEEFIIGMAHRGRLNVLANILNKTYQDIFNEFEGKEFEESSSFDGDVKYHVGYSTNVVTKHGHKVHLSLTPNPSHLEAVSPVVEGISRAKIDSIYNGDFNKLAPILIHGDAAIAGQGVVYEVAQMSRLKGYKTGGTIHLVINNQVGFTTNYIDARSSTYCTDVGKIGLSPVFHVNGDDVEALIYTIQLAMEFRQRFHRDIFIDILCYRRYGHNEGDEPRFTQPLLYKAIAGHPNPREIYLKKLAEQGAVESELAKEMEQNFKQLLQERLEDAKQIRKTKITSFLEGVWKGINITTDKDFEYSVQTGVEKDIVLTTAYKISEIPQCKKFFNKIEKLFNDRRKMTENGTFDWAMGELLAYGTLLHEGFPVRVSGQDVERGTFSHRHAIAKLEDSEEEYIPLNQISNTQAKFQIYNSLLSEYAVLGFDYGYAMASPQTLAIWEAQFGDFSNGAQIIIDQYLSSSEDKWRRMNGICLFLPHGYEGQGAEHSSARLERYLTLCAENNMYVVNCTTPANFFHVLRRQMHNSFRKPLIALTPKSLLRHPKCVSTVNDFITGTHFQEIIDDATAQVLSTKRLVFCSGKIYYELAERKINDRRNDIALVRLEQLYPLPHKQLQDIFTKYKYAKEYCWVQEEPENMGAWSYLLRTFKGVPLKVIARPESASPATGSYRQHQEQQKTIIERTFEKNS